MESLLVSTGVVALAEMGDKTQLLSLLLAARYRKPWPIIAGILIATLVNHGFAGALGGWITHMVGAGLLRWILGLGFIAMGAWMLIPDKLDDAEQPRPVKGTIGVLSTTIAAFFFAEMGDKTQIATVALAARFSGDVLAVVAGTTLGMMLANVPAVLLGERFAHKLPITLVHRIAAGIFVLLGVLALLNVGG
ncbi:putative Ca2+/H+ antiporter (TMEM165/GDT1 family) [Cupriavidus gilardii J11]|uniref:GDT1 family protein n=1 Tax=Cupriavidus gilardii J11 TaxID=936133 RepID=A0A562B262_9BURK|nr:TMEM165/GDT1 family protein [Cupriavidus gilardii]TWG79203.1 putative Ca2+/H+ antiporter (TMEM165/GDT1 family) [Cupriavidus gilardii J11]